MGARRGVKADLGPPQPPQLCRAGVREAVGIGELVGVGGLGGPREVRDALALTVGFRLSGSA